MVLPQPDGTLYVGLTDEPVDGDIPDVPEPSEPEIGFLLDVVSAAFARRCTAPTSSGRTPGCARCSPPATARGTTSDLSRRHAVLTSDDRRGHDRRRQAHDVPPDGRGRRRRRASPTPGSGAGRCRTRDLPLLGAAPRAAARPSSRSRPAWYAATAPTPRSCSTTPATVSGLADDELLAPVADRRAGHPRRADLRGHPRGRRRRRRPARPPHPGRAGRRPTAPSPYPPPSPRSRSEFAAQR